MELAPIRPTPSFVLREARECLARTRADNICFRRSHAQDLHNPRHCSDLDNELSSIWQPVPLNQTLAAGSREFSAGSAAPRPPPSNHSNFAPLQQNPNTHSHPSTATQASQQSCIGQAQAHLPPCTILRASPTLDPQTDHTLQAAVQATAYLPQVSVQQHEKHHRAHIVLLPCKEHEDAIMTSGTADDDASKEHASCSRHAHVLAHASRDGTHSRSTSSRVLMKRNSSRKGRRKLMQCSSNSSSKSRSKSSFARRGLSNPAQAAGAPASDAAAMRPDTAGTEKRLRRFASFNFKVLMVGRNSMRTRHPVRLAAQRALEDAATRARAADRAAIRLRLQGPCKGTRTRAVIADGQLAHALHPIHPHAAAKADVHALTAAGQIGYLFTQDPSMGQRLPSPTKVNGRQAPVLAERMIAQLRRDSCCNIVLQRASCAVPSSHSSTSTSPERGPTWAGAAIVESCGMSHAERSAPLPRLSGPRPLAPSPPHVPVPAPQHPSHMPQLTSSMRDSPGASKALSDEPSEAARLQGPLAPLRLSDGGDNQSGSHATGNKASGGAGADPAASLFAAITRTPLPAPKKTMPWDTVDLSDVHAASSTSCTTGPGKVRQGCAPDVSTHQCMAVKHAELQTEHYCAPLGAHHPAKSRAVQLAQSVEAVRKMDPIPWRVTRVKTRKWAIASAAVVTHGSAEDIVSGARVRGAGCTHAAGFAARRAMTCSELEDRNLVTYMVHEAARRERHSVVHDH